MLLVSD